MAGEMARATLNGAAVYEIAQVHEVTEAAVWEGLGRVARAASGQGVEPVVTGGFGSDTTAGLTGGYGAIWPFFPPAKSRLAFFYILFDTPVGGLLCDR